MRTPAIVCLALWCSLLPAAAKAEPFTVLPNGELVFNVAFTTTGTFTCGLIAACTGSGTNSVTLGSGTSAMTLTFTGVDRMVALGNTTVPVSLGTFTAATADPPGTVPAGPNPNAEILHFRLSVFQTSPVAATGRLLMDLGPGGGESLPLLRGIDNVSLVAGPNPPGFRYTHLVYTLRPYPPLIQGNGVTELQTVAGAIPEPATMMLVGSGLAGAAFIRRRRRQPMDRP